MHCFEKRAKLMLTLFSQLLPFLAFAIFLMPVAVICRTKNKPWVISGHKGKYYEDNSKAVHQYTINNTCQKIIWISSSKALTNSLKKQGSLVLRKHSFKARWAILVSPVLLYSHGEDDLDNFLIVMRRVLGVRIFLSHTLNHIKGPLKKAKRHLLTDFDYLLATSEKEMENLSLLYPGRERKFRLGGGAHMDQFFINRGVEPENLIVYFPTHRESNESIEGLSQVLNDIVSSNQLVGWLSDNNYKFVICCHVNSNVYSKLRMAKNFIQASPDELLPYLIKCRLLISDYSGIITNYLVLDKPIILFPFDMIDFSSRRVIYGKYTDMCYGEKVTTVAELQKLIISHTWIDEDYLQREKREKLVKEIYPFMEASYAKRSFESIQNIIDECA